MANQNVTSNRPSANDWATLIEKVILAILGFLTGSGVMSAMNYFTF